MARSDNGNNPDRAQEAILTTDDLVMEIGILHVRLLEAQKQIRELSQEIQRLREVQSENQALKTSNALLNQKNRELDRALVQARQEIENLRREVSRLQAAEAPKKRRRRGVSSGAEHDSG